jgi:hypothetical protein
MSDSGNLYIEEIAKEPGLLIRSCKIKINGNVAITPTKTIGVKSSDTTEVKIVEDQIDNNFRPFGEVYAKISLSELSEYIKNDEKGQKFTSQLAYKLSQLNQIGALPYILLSIVDENGNPVNRLLSKPVQKFLFDVLWGTPGNKIITTPLIGTLSTPDEYAKMINAFRERQLAAIDRKNLPIMAIVPPSYSLIDPNLLKKYWQAGVRIYGYNCENKKYGAFGYVIESIHNELSKFSKQDEEMYIINALNSKYKIGKTKTSRVNDLIGTGFGFDTYSPNHIPTKFIPPVKMKHYLFDREDYGFIEVNEIENVKNAEKILNSNILKNVDLSQLSEYPEDKVKKICKTHDFETNITEISQYCKLIKKEKLFHYLSSKEKIRNETHEISEFRHGHQINLDGWFT